MHRQWGLPSGTPKEQLVAGPKDLLIPVEHCRHNGLFRGQMGLIIVVPTIPGVRPAVASVLMLARGQVAFQFVRLHLRLPVWNVRWYSTRGVANEACRYPTLVK